MNLEDQVVSLELAKRLKELGVEQESYFYWLTSIHHGDELINSNKLLDEKAYPVKQYSAFTVGELGFILRKCEEKIKNHEVGYYTTYGYFKVVIKPSRFTGKESFCVRCINEANARAQAIIYFLENELIKVEDLNK